MLHFLIPGLALWADRYTKSSAQKGAEMVPPFAGHLEWHHAENPGLAGGMLQKHPDAVKGIQASACGVMTLCLLGSRKKNGLAKCGAWFLLLGAFSNLYDRLSRGTVTDLLRFPRAPGKLKTLVFNLADFMLLTGAILSLLGRLFRKRS